MAWRWSVCGTAEVVWKPRFLWQWPSAHLHCWVWCVMSLNSLDLNPIENLWGIVKRKMRDTRPNNADDLNPIENIWGIVKRKMRDITQKKSTVNAAIYQENFRALHASFCWQALWRCWFHFPAGLGTCPHCQRYQKLVQWPWCCWPIKHSNTMVIEPAFGTFGSVGRCQVLLENEISISIKLVSRRKHEVL